MCDWNLFGGFSPFDLFFGIFVHSGKLKKEGSPVNQIAVRVVGLIHWCLVTCLILMFSEGFIDRPDSWGVVFVILHCPQMLGVDLLSDFFRDSTQRTFSSYCRADYNCFHLLL